MCHTGPGKELSFHSDSGSGPLFRDRHEYTPAVNGMPESEGRRACFLTAEKAFSGTEDTD